MNFVSNHAFIHKSASQLISEGKQQDWGNDKKTDSAELNQIILLKQLEKLATQTQIYYWMVISFFLEKIKILSNYQPQFLKI